MPLFIRLLSLCLCSQQICKQTYTDFLTCALSVDISVDPVDQSISFSNPSQCDLFYASQFQACYGGFWALYAAGDIGTGSPPAAIAGGITKKGNAYAYYSLPANEGYNSKGVYPVHNLDCKVCGQFFKRLLQCALPFDFNQKDLRGALLGCAGITKDQNDDFVFTNAEDYFVATTCGLLNQQFSFPASEPDASGRVSYALVTPVFASVIRENCPTMEARATANGKVTVKVLKGNIVF